MMKRIFLATLILILLGSSAGAVTFDDAMDKTEEMNAGLFPSWEDKEHGEFWVNPRVKGVIGQNQDGEVVGGKKTEKLLMLYIPHLINILLKFVAPLIMATMIYAGIRFVYAGSDEEELNQAKEFFTYTLMGALFVVLSYSIMKALYYILASS